MQWTKTSKSPSAAHDKKVSALKEILLCGKKKVQNLLLYFVSKPQYLILISALFWQAAKQTVQVKQDKPNLYRSWTQPCKLQLSQLP